MKKRWTRAAVGATLAGALGVPAMIASPTAHAAGWSLTGTLAEPLAGLTDLGPLPASTPVPVTVALGLRNVAELHRDIASGTVLTPAQFDSRFAPTASAAGQVADYLRHQGFTGVTVSPNRVLVSATGTAGRAETAFHTSLRSVRRAGLDLFANATAARVPAALGGIVVSVLGLNDLGRMTPAPTPSANPASSCVLPGGGYPCTYNPQGFWKAYDATNAPTGAATPIAVFAEGDLTQVVKDLHTEEAANGLPQIQPVIVPTGPASTDTSGTDEWDLDTQYSTGMAGNVSSLYIYDATTLTDSDIAREVSRFASDDLAKAGSASFGECEYQAYLDGSMLADDEAFAQAAVQGQTVFASAGDTGGFCPVAPTNGVPLGVPDVNYPASSPYVVSVGGTSLVTSPDGSYSHELAWLAGGGGLSLFESSPAWQAGDGSLYSKLTTVCQVQGCGRTVPDVANDADPNSGANVYVDGTPMAVGGTSLASPLTLGEWARLESNSGNGLGFAAPLLYGGLGTPAFHDIVLGDTGPYPAAPGYDLATGIGTMDVGRAVSTIK